MKKAGLIALIILPLNWISAQNLKPYLLGFKTTETVSEIKSKVVENMEQNGLKVVGEYQPAADKDRWIVIFSSSELESAVKKIGGLSGFAATLRVGITRENGTTIVSYTNPVYWGNAYFRDDFDQVASNYVSLNAKLESAMKVSGTYLGTAFGSEKGITSDDLRKYHYMMGMPRFDDTEELEEFENHEAALEKVESAIKRGVPDVKMVYQVSIPEKNISLFGFALSGENGESKFLPIVDIAKPKHTAFLPYEVLVLDNQVLMLHGRFRIALSFPDLTMGTFTKIMSTPGDIEDLLEQLVK